MALHVFRTPVSLVTLRFRTPLINLISDVTVQRLQSVLGLHICHLPFSCPTRCLEIESARYHPVEQPDVNVNCSIALVHILMRAAFSVHFVHILDATLDVNVRWHLYASLLLLSGPSARHCSKMQRNSNTPPGTDKLQLRKANAVEKNILPIAFFGRIDLERLSCAFPQFLAAGFLGLCNCSLCFLLGS